MTEAETVNTFEKQLVKVLCPEFPLGGEGELSGVGECGYESIQRQREHLQDSQYPVGPGQLLYPIKQTSAHHFQPEGLRVLKQA